MPNWNELVNEVKAAGSTHDITRRKYLGQLHEFTGRNVIVYYSGWLQKSVLQPQGAIGFEIDDNDKNGFMTVIHNLERSKGLDLFLHTPGGSMVATESLVDYLRSMFGNDIRAIVPQIAMSGGTMIALACKEILMGKHSSLGPIDPQISGMPAHGVIEEFNQAQEAIQRNPTIAPLWQAIFSKYHPTLIGESAKAVQWAGQIVKDWLITGMFKDKPDAKADAEKVIDELANHALTLSHDRHISMEQAKDLGLKIVALEDNHEFQEATLTVHHACVQTLADTPAYKIIENHLGVAFISSVQTAIVQQ